MARRLVVGGLQAEIRDGYWAIFDITELAIEPGSRLVELVEERVTAFAAKYHDLISGGHEDLAHRPGGADGVSTVPGRTPCASSTFEFHRTNLRGDQAAHQSHRPLPRRDQRRQPGVGGARPRLARLARPHHDPIGTRLLHDLRRSLLDPPRNLRPPQRRASGGHAEAASATA